MPDNIWRGWP